MAGIEDAMGTISNGLSSPMKSVSDFTSSLGVDTSKFPSVSDISDQLKTGGIGDILGGAGPSYHVLYRMSGRKDPIMAYNWFCEVPRVGSYALPWHYIEEITAPFQSFDVLSRYKQGQMEHFAGLGSISTLSLKLYDDSTGTAGAFLNAWRSAVRGPILGDGMSGRRYNYPNGPAGYKKTITLTVLDVSRFIQVYQFKFIGCWPTNSEPYNFTSGESTRMTMSQEFSVDDVQVRVRGLSIAGLATSIYNAVANFPGGLVKEISGMDTLSGPARGTFDSSSTFVNTPAGGFGSTR